MKDDLSNILSKWTGIEPRADFNNEVWKSIRTTEPAAAKPLISRWWAPVFGTSPVLAAASVLVALGIGLGIALATRSTPSPFEGRFSMMRPGSITGDYAILAKGD